MGKKKKVGAYIQSDYAGGMKKVPIKKRLSPEEAAKSRAKWNVRDWAKPKQYDYVERLKENQLRWEFLRRDDNYRTDWLLGKPYGHGKYELDAWHDPAQESTPKFMQPCYLIDFSERDKTKQFLHYAALSESKSFGGFVFNVDGNSPLKPQLAYIKTIHENYAKNATSPEERRKRDKRKNNKNGRSPALLLRVLDAYNEGVSIKELADTFGGEDGITEAAMRRTLNFAQGYWRRF